MLSVLAAAPAIAGSEWPVIGNDTKIECRQEGPTKVKPGEDRVTFINLAEGKWFPHENGEVVGKNLEERSRLKTLGERFQHLGKPGLIGTENPQ